MYDLLIQWSQRPNLLIYLCVAGAVMLTVELAGLSYARLRSNRSSINKRLQLLQQGDDRENVLIELRRDRGLTADGSFSFSLLHVNQLILQSGVNTRGPMLFVVIFISIVAGGVAGLFVLGSPPLAVVLGLVCGVVAPLLVLLVKRNRRRTKFGNQLPEALDIMVRSLRAGHPVSVAVSLVARELPDPIGSEFGMTADEMTFGLDLETSLKNMSNRVGHQDLPFAVVAVSIQTKTGGNLSEVLSNLSRVIRERFQLRRRVKAMSAEGKLSAGALSLIPVVVFLAINFLTPSFYGDVKNDPIVFPIAVITFAVWATGIYVIYRLVNFKY